MGESSHLRIQTHEGRDLVAIDLETGALEIADPARLGDAARAFWDAVQTAWIALRVDSPRLDPHFTDFILRAGETVPRMGGKIQLKPGTDGDISIFLPSPPEPRYDLTKLNDDTVTACYVDDETRPFRFSDYTSSDDAEHA